MNQQVERGLIGLRILNDITDAYRGVRTLVSKPQSSTPTFVWVAGAFVVGAVAGSVAALFLTPVTGPALRKRAARELDAIKSRVSEEAQNIADMTGLSSASGSRSHAVSNGHKGHGRSHRASA